MYIPVQWNNVYTFAIFHWPGLRSDYRDADTPVHRDASPGTIPLPARSRSARLHHRVRRRHARVGRPRSLPVHQVPPQLLLLQVWSGGENVSRFVKSEQWQIRACGVGVKGACTPLQDIFYSQGRSDVTAHCYPFTTRLSTKGKLLYTSEWDFSSKSGFLSKCWYLLIFGWRIQK